MQKVLPKDKTFTMDDKVSNEINNHIGSKKKSLNLDDYYDSRNKTEFLSNLDTENQKKLIAFNSYALKSLELTIKEDSEQVSSLAPLKGEIWCLDFGLNVGRETSKIRPCIIVSYEQFNANSGLVTVIPITTSVSDILRHTQFIVDKNCVEGNDTQVHGCAKAEGITTKSKSRLGKKIGKLNDKGIVLLNNALCAHLVLITDNDINNNDILYI